MEIEEVNFPNHEDGDAKIVLGASRIHRVESRVLRWAAEVGRREMQQDDQLDGDCSFSILFAPERAAALSKKALKKRVSTRYHIVATDVTTDENGRYHIELTSVPLDKDGRPLEQVRPYLGLETGQGTLPVFEAFTEILGSLYDKPINLGGANETVRDRIQNALHMIDLAEQLGVKHCIAPEVVAALKVPPQRGPSFFSVICNGPEYWFDFAYRIRSHEIYREALIQTVGRYQTAQLRDIASRVSEENYSIIEQKATDIKERVKTLFHNILTYYPSELHRTAVTGYADTDNIGRNSYSNDIFLWMALSIYRHFISQEAIEAIESEDMGYDIVSRIAKGGDSYCTMADVGPFFGFFPMTAKARDVVEKKIREIKDHVKPWAQTLANNYAEPDPDTVNLGFFTCTNLDEDEYPFDEVDRG